MSALWKGFAVAVFVAVVTGGIYEARQASALRTRVQVLEQQGDHMQQLQAERDRATNRLALLTAENERLKSDSSALLKLRSEVTRLDSQQVEAARLRQENQQLRTAAESRRPAPAAAPPPADYLTKESWTYAGYDTPEAALQTIAWAMTRGDTRNFLASLTPEEMARTQNGWQGKTEAEIATEIQNDVSGGKDGPVAGFRVLKKEALSDTEMVITLDVSGLPPNQSTPQMKLQRIGNQWRFAGVYNPGK